MKKIIILKSILFYYSDKKRFELDDENVPLLKKVVLSDQSGKG